jgi:large subunit ribosomal protein L21
MRYVIIESGGKQYRAVEGRTIEVDRLASEPGDKLEIERILLMADGDEFLIGTPTLSDIQVRTTVVDHFRGDKVISYKYSPKKRIRVKGGHRQQYTRLMVDFIGRPGETRKTEKAEPVEQKPARKSEPKAKAEKPAAKVEPKKASPAKTEKAPAKKPAAAAKTKKPTTTKSSPAKGKKSTK